MSGDSKRRLTFLPSEDRRIGHRQDEGAPHAAGSLSSGGRPDGFPLPSSRFRRDRLRQDVQDWKEQAQRKRLTWRGLFGGGKDSSGGA